MLKERVLSAIVLIALVLCALFLFTPFYFALALGFVATLGIWEWAQFARFKNPLAQAPLLRIYQEYPVCIVPHRSSTQSVRRMPSRYHQDVLS